MGDLGAGGCDKPAQHPGGRALLGRLVARQLAVDVVGDDARGAAEAGEKVGRQSSARTHRLPQTRHDDLQMRGAHGGRAVLFVAHGDAREHRVDKCVLVAHGLMHVVPPGDRPRDGLAAGIGGQVVEPDKRLEDADDFVVELLEHRQRVFAQRDEQSRARVKRREHVRELFDHDIAADEQLLELVEDEDEGASRAVCGGGDERPELAILRRCSEGRVDRGGRSIHPVRADENAADEAFATGVQPRDDAGPQQRGLADAAWPKEHRERARQHVRGHAADVGLAPAEPFRRSRRTGRDPGRDPAARRPRSRRGGLHLLDPVGELGLYQRDPVVLPECWSYSFGSRWTAHDACPRLIPPDVEQEDAKVPVAQPIAEEQHRTPGPLADCGGSRLITSRK